MRDITQTDGEFRLHIQCSALSLGIIDADELVCDYPVWQTVLVTRSEKYVKHARRFHTYDSEWQGYKHEDS